MHQPGRAVQLRPQLRPGEPAVRLQRPPRTPGSGCVRQPVRAKQSIDFSVQGGAARPNIDHNFYIFRALLILCFCVGYFNTLIYRLVMYSTETFFVFYS